MLVRNLSAHRGSQWIVDGWALFRMRPAVWIALGAIDLAVTVVLASIPFVDNLIPVFTVLFAGGMTAAAVACRESGTVRIADALDGVRRHFRPLFALSLVGLLAALVCDFAEMWMSASVQQLANGGSGGALWLAGLIYVVTVSIAAAALWLSPSLVVLRGTQSHGDSRWSPAAALKASLVAIWRNRGASLVYGLVVAGLTGAALLTLGIGLLVVAPLVYLSTYTACRDLFDD